jgi:hypothetical protein
VLHWGALEDTLPYRSGAQGVMVSQQTATCFSTPTMFGGSKASRTARL